MRAASEPRRKAVVLLSGGLDSCTAAAMAKAEGFDLYALTVAYGQRHAVELDAARRVAAALGVVRHVELQLDLSAFGGSAADRGRPGAEGPRDRRARHPVHLRARAQHGVPVARAGLGGGAWRVGHLHRRERRRLLRLPGLPAGVHRVVRADGRARDQGRRRRRAVPHPHAPHQPHEGRDHPPGPGSRRRLRAHQQLLRSRRWTAPRAATATAACSGPGDSRKRACSDPQEHP